jgi:membrane protease YdiL (CAAX protease family)
LRRRLFQWRVGLRWYVFAVGYMAAIKLAVALVHRVATGSWPLFSPVAWYLMLAATVISTVIGGQAGEEIGWRGYALPRLAARFGLARGSVLLGVIWATWHLPLFFIPGTDTTGQSFTVYLLGVTPLSVAIAWLYWRTNGSLLLTMLMHAVINNTTGIVPSIVPAATNPWTLSTSRVAWLTLALLWICAGYFLARMSKAELPRTKDRTR